MRSIALMLLPIVLVTVAGCAQLGLSENVVDESAVREEPGRREPTRVVVQHVLIAHTDADIPGVTRTVPEAERLAAEVLRRARAGESFDELVRYYTDDRNNNGVYPIANFGAPLEKPNEVERVSLVRAFGDLAFSMDVGSIELVEYDEERSPFGYHVVQRLQ